MPVSAPRNQTNNVASDVKPTFLRGHGPHSEKAPQKEIAIVGAGPRGVVDLGGLISQLRKTPPQASVTIHLIDPQVAGAGCHPPDLPSYLVTNTLAVDCTAYSHGWNYPSYTKKNCADWARASGYRMIGRDMQRTRAGRPISDVDHIPRRILGLYFGWCAKTFSAARPKSLNIVHHKSTAVSVQPRMSKFELRLANGTRVTSDTLIVATGHTVATVDPVHARFETYAMQNLYRSRAPHYFDGTYPVERLNRIAPQERVAVQGLGLTGIDALSVLTEGRGGTFVKERGRLRYSPSGREPDIFVYSRHGIPSFARDFAAERNAGPYNPEFLTCSAIRALRSTGPLDFVADVLPLLRQEMAQAYMNASEPSEQCTTEQVAQAIERIFDPYAGRAFQNMAAFEQAFICTIDQDLDETRRFSVIKRTVQAVRSCYPALCEAVEYCGVTPSSQKVFLEEFLGFLTRAVFSTLRFRMEQFQALLRSNVLRLVGGPGAELNKATEGGGFLVTTPFADGMHQTPVQHVIAARLPRFRLDHERRGLYRSLARQRLIHASQNGSYQPGGIDVDRLGRAKSNKPNASRQLFVLGYPTEGVRFFKHALPRADRKIHHVFEEVNRISASLFQVSEIT